MRATAKLLCSIVATAMLAASVPAEARITQNTLATNKIALNQRAIDTVQAVAVAPQLSVQRRVGDGEVTMISAIRFVDVTRIRN